MFDFLSQVTVWSADPVAFSLPFAGLQVRWYGLVYALGAMGAMWLVPRYVRLFPHAPQLKKKQWEDFVFWTFIWGVIGGRLGNFVFYSPDVLVANPLEVFQIWHGGMSIHGGLVGALGYIFAWSRRHAAPFWAVVDVLTLPMAAILIFGRLANWTNGEIVGTVTDGTFGIIFPHFDEMARHPVQLYSAAKNTVLSLVLGAALYFSAPRRYGVMSGLFLFAYGGLRAAVATFREPEAFLGSIPMGQALSLMMIVFGVGLIVRSAKAE